MMCLLLFLFKTFENRGFSNGLEANVPKTLVLTKKPLTLNIKLKQSKK